MAKTRNLDRNAIAQRANDARAHLKAAELFADEPDAASWKVAGSNAAIAGIAAADAICGRVLGYCSASDSHADAIKLLERATRPNTAPANNLQRLLNDTSLFQYGASRVTHAHAQGLVKHARRLIESMDALL